MVNYINKLNKIAKILANSQEVNFFNSSEEKEANALAYTLLDIYESAEELIVLIKKLEDESVSEEVINDILNDIGEELRHIIYHTNNSKFYNYIDIQEEE